MDKLWAWYPPIGVYIAILALLGVLVALLRDVTKIGRREKALWTAIMFILVLLEIKSIYQDRYAHDKEQSEARAEQLKQFDTIAKGINTTISNSQQQFDATIKRVEGVSRIAARGLENVTGGDSFGFVVPQAFGSQEVPLRIWNHGNQVLSGVTLTISRTQDPDWGRAFYKPIFIGTIGPNDSVPVPVTIIPKPEQKSGEDNYWIMISAQNGTVSESLWFRHGRKSTPWAYSYLITKHVTLSKRKGVIPKGAQLMEPILYRPWSDEVDAPH